MSKTVAYYLENYIGRAIGFGLGIFCIVRHKGFSVIVNSSFFDKLISLCTPMFGFLLTILTLIIQSNNKAITELREYPSYKRLILFNKRIVILSAIICVLSLLLITTKDKLYSINELLLTIPSSINLALFTWFLIDVGIFVLIFYALIINDANDGSE